MDKVSGKLATSCTPEMAKQTQSNANDNMFSADVFTGARGSNNNTSSSDDVHNCGDTKPQVSLSAPNNCDGSCVFTATVNQGTHALSNDKFPGTVELYVNGSKVQSQGISASGSVTFTYTPTMAGTTTVEAKVIDSVLYSASESATVTLSPGSAAGPDPGSP